jgi:subtilase family protein
MGIVLAVVAVTFGLLNAPSAGAGSSRGAPQAGAAADRTSRQIVTLVTGDRVAVSTLADGRTVAALLPGSPHAGKPIQTVTLGGDLYVRPSGLSAAEASRLDASMFNVTRLARLTSADGRAPVRVIFGPGVQAHDVPGVDVSSTARTTGSDRAVARGSYDAAGEPTGTWRGVTSVALPGRDASAAESAAARYELHTLTVDVTNRRGQPANCSSVIVMNVDDAALFSFLDFCAVGGRTKLSVPAGNYAVIADVFDRRSWSLAAVQQFPVSDDATVSVTARKATTQVVFPKVRGAKPIEATFNYIRSAEERGSFSIGFSYFAGTNFLVQPTKPPTVGDLRSGLRASLRIPHGKRPATPVESYDWKRGVPKDLTVRHPRSDFADVTARYYSDGRSHRGLLGFGTFAFMPGQNGDFASVWPTRTPLMRHELYLGGGRVAWSPFAMMLRFSRNDFSAVEIDGGLRHYRPGERRAESWLRGPLGPGAGVAVSPRRVGPRCPACRIGDVVRLDVAPLTDAYPDHRGYLWGPNPWVLRHGDDVLAHGRFPGAKVELPARQQRYTFEQRFKMPEFYRLSTRSKATWAFDSGTGTRPLPLLMPRYDLPVDLMNRLPAGRTSFRLAIPRLGDKHVSVVKPTVKVSYNGGKTWKRAKVVRRGSDVFRVRLDNPRPSGEPRYGSLQIHAKDRAGNAVTQTIKRAWQIRAGGRGAATAGPSAIAPADAAPSLDGARRACGAITDQQFRCLALVGASGSAALNARADPAGYGAAELRDAYDLPPTGGAGQTVAVVVAGDYPTAAKDVNVYRQQFGLRPCTVASGCFTKLNQKGVEGDYPRKDHGWALEAALDLQMVSASCPRCHLVLVEANSPYFGSMLKAVDTAAAHADVVNNSYGAYEFTGIKKLAKHYDVDGVPMTVSSGDFGYEPANFPSSAPSVISVGGTSLRHADNDRGWRERAWRFGGSGCSAYFAKPAWQSDAACHMRTAADVAAVGDPNTGVSVYDSFGLFGEKGWFVVGGTSASSPLVAGMIAAAGDADSFSAADLYANTGALHDVTGGTNRVFYICEGSYICNGKPGYDAPTGNGTPDGVEAFTDVTP